MLSTIRKKLVLLTIIPLVICFYSHPLVATHKPPRLFIYDYGGYIFTAFYNLQTPSEPSGLLVKMLAEYNLKHSVCGDRMWLPQMRFLELRFTLNGSQKKVEIWQVDDGDYKVVGLDTITTSIWYHAIKKIAENLGTQCYGSHQQRIKSSPTKHGKMPSASVHIKPLKNRKLHATYDLDIRSSRSRQKPVTVDVDVHVETYQGKKMIVASATFCDKGVALVQEDYASIKFVNTKRGLKEIAKERVTHASIWYPWVKKVVQKSVNRYLRFKRRHNYVGKTVLIQKVNTHLIENTPEPQYRGELVCIPYICGL